MWRIARCNPLTHFCARDPVRRPTRFRVRVGSLPTAFALIALTGLLVLTISAIALGQEVTGGCAARVNGMSPVFMTRGSPLVVFEGQVVRVRGSVPPDVLAVPEDQVNSRTIIRVSGVEGVIGFKGELHLGRGHTWGVQVNVDRYLGWGVGLYRVTAEAIGDPGWRCEASGYLKLDGNPLSKPAGQAAAATATAGGVGAVASTGDEASPR